MICSSCGTENRPGRKFCLQCGAALSVSCPNCGAENEPESRFCGECGVALAQDASGVPAGASPRPKAPVAARSERRLVSVLFADLVGFTTLSEQRDAEEVRELLGRYFDTCRAVVARYGGQIEKFIGDAVMAVWGAPTAQEDDAERAVRAALELTEAVTNLGSKVGQPELRARAGVLTGEVAVNLGAEGQGMVAGDVVNTASRVQSAAEPGMVLVGDATKRATEAAIAYEDAGIHDLKGKAEPVQLWRARRVVAAIRGALRSPGLEPPFVGRDRELRMVKDLFHATAEEHRAHLLHVVGIAGIGKSRLSWELFKYLDGLSDTVYWHRGRCLAYGEGVTYWALAEMVRMRTGIAEGEPDHDAARKLKETVERWVPDTEERGWIEPRLAYLLGLEESTVRARDDLFGAWRLFFERLSESGPVLLVFEDLQWADAALLDFIEYLLEWSRGHALFVVTLARPELADRRADWGAGKRSFTSQYLEPLQDSAMRELLEGLAPGLPPDLVDRIAERAAGVPLYAVETVRMLLDRGLLVREGSAYRPTGPVEALEVPETLHALIAARLDGLTPDERRAVQDASVLGKTFRAASLVRLTGLAPASLDGVLTSLVRKEVLSLHVDPRSPERGQYAFLQDLMRRVAYEGLSRGDRKTRHLAAAAALQEEWADAEVDVVEVIASHFLDAYRAAPDAADASEIRETARALLVRAGERAQSLAATHEARHYFEVALELCDEQLERADLLERAGVMARFEGDIEGSMAHLEAASGLFDAAGRTHESARVSGKLAETMWAAGRAREAVDRMEASFAVLSNDDPDPDLAAFVAQLARYHWFVGEPAVAKERIDFALGIAESLELHEILSHALNTKSLVLLSERRFEECQALLRHALSIASQHGLLEAEQRALFNLGNHLASATRFREAMELDRRALDVSRRMGSRTNEWTSLMHLIWEHAWLGEWDEAMAIVAGMEEEDVNPQFRPVIESFAFIVWINRGDLETPTRILVELEKVMDPDESQDRAWLAMSQAELARAKGEFDAAIEAAERCLAERPVLSLRSGGILAGLPIGADVCISAGLLDRAEGFLRIADDAAPSEVTPQLEAERARLGAKLAAARGSMDGVGEGFARAEAILREVEMRFALASALTEHGEWLMGEGRAADAQPLLEEAGTIFEHLRATPWIERVVRARGGAAAVAAG